MSRTSSSTNRSSFTFFPSSQTWDSSVSLSLLSDFIGSRSGLGIWVGDLRLFRSQLTLAAASLKISPPVSANPVPSGSTDEEAQTSTDEEEVQPQMKPSDPVSTEKTIAFGPESHPPRESGKAIYVPPPHLRDKGYPLEEVKTEERRSLEQDRIQPVESHKTVSLKRTGLSLERIASSAFVIGPSRKASVQHHPTIHKRIPTLSKGAVAGRNSIFHNLSPEDRDMLGGIEYRALKVLLVVTLGQLWGSERLNMLTSGSVFLRPTSFGGHLSPPLDP